MSVSPQVDCTLAILLYMLSYSSSEECPEMLSGSEECGVMQVLRMVLSLYLCLV